MAPVAMPTAWVLQDIEESQPTFARPGGRFQPMAKRRPRKEGAGAVPSTLPEANSTEEKATTVSSTGLDDEQSAQHVDVKENMLMNGCCDENGSLEPVEYSTQLLVTGEDVGPKDSLLSDVILSNSNCDLHPIIEKTAGKVDSMGVDLDPGVTIELSTTLASSVLDSEYSVDPGDDRVIDHIGLSSVASENIWRNDPMTKTCASSLLSSDDNKSSGISNPSQPVSATDQHAEILASSAIAMVPEGSSDWHSSTGKSVVENADGFSGLEYLDDILNRPTSEAAQGPMSCREASVSNDNGYIQIGNRRLETEEAGEDPLLNASNSGANLTSGQRAGKFKLKPRLKTGKEKTSNTHPDTAILPPQASQMVSSESICVDKGAASASDDILSYLYVLDPNTEVPVNEEPTNLQETCSSYGGTIMEDGIHLEDLPSMPGDVNCKSTIEKTETAAGISQNLEDSCTVGEEYECGKSTRQLRKRVPRQLVNEPDDEDTNCGGGVPDEPASNSDIGEDEYNVDECTVGRTPQKRKDARKSMKPADENGKPTRKRKGTSEAATSPTAEKRSKKFSHSTRRNKRQVDKALLETPEDEIDFQRIPIRDLIIFHEHKERLAKKEAKSKIPSLNQRGNNVGHEETRRSDEGTSDLEQDKGSDDDQVIVDINAVCFNYQSFMDKSARVKWSNQDTELFYEAIRQFGTDFYMIQQLFPGRTHQQIKLKFKHEERRHPLQLSEAMTNRGKDHSHFKSVIERLQQVAAQEKEVACGDELNDNTGEGVEELKPQANEEVAKSEQQERDDINDKDAHVEQVHHSPSKSEGSDDELSRWNQYKCDY